MRRPMLLLAAMLCASLLMAAPALASHTASTTGSSNVTATSALVSGVVENSDEWYVEYRKWNTGAAFSETPHQTGNGSVSTTLTNLESNTTYEFRFRAVKSGEVEIANGGERYFQTEVPDTDGDGFKDNQDACPNTPGIQNGHPGQGCPPPPDSDGDGFIDMNDSCPTQPGGAQNPPYNAQGCPAPPDPDGDGFPDGHDACPGEKGGAQGPDNNQGCPRRDSDGDGYFDSEDQCPQGPPEFAVGGPASPENGNRQGCPVKDEDKDGIADVNDKCPKVGNAYEMGEGGQFTDKLIKEVRPAGHKYAGCIKLSAVWYALRAIKAFPSMKDFLKDQKFTWSMLCNGGGVGGVNWPPCKITQTLSFDAATTKKLKLRSPVIDTISDSSPGKASGVCTACYLFNPGPNYEIPASIKKKLAKLKTVTVLLTVDLTDTTLNEKSRWRTKIEVGTRKKPKELTEL